MDFRTKRQLIALFTLVAILGVAAFVFWRSFVYVETCTDGRLNQNEEAVDCGGACIPCLVKSRKDVEVRWVRAVTSRVGVYDAVAEVRNPNDRVAANRFDYEFRLLDSAGNVIARQQGRSYLYARELVHLVEFGIRAPAAAVTRAEFSILDTEWTVSDALLPDVIAANRMYAVESDEGVDRSVLRAILRNRSLREMTHLFITAFALDGNGNLLGANGTEIAELKAADAVPVVFAWPVVFAAPVESIIIEARPREFGR